MRTDEAPSCLGELWELAEWADDIRTSHGEPSLFSPDSNDDLDYATASGKLIHQNALNQWRQRQERIADSTPSLFSGFVYAVRTPRTEFHALDPLKRIAETPERFTWRGASAQIGAVNILQTSDTECELLPGDANRSETAILTGICRNATTTSELLELLDRCGDLVLIIRQQFGGLADELSVTCLGETVLSEPWARWVQECLVNRKTAGTPVWLVQSNCATPSRISLDGFSSAHVRQAVAETRRGEVEPGLGGLLLGIQQDPPSAPVTPAFLERAPWAAWSESWDLLLLTVFRLLDLTRAVERACVAPGDLIHQTVAAEICEVSERTIQRRVDDGSLVGWGPRGKRLVSRADVENLHKQGLASKQRSRSSPRRGRNPAN